MLFSPLLKQSQPMGSRGRNCCLCQLGVAFHELVVDSEHNFASHPQLMVSCKLL